VLHRHDDLLVSLGWNVTAVWLLVQVLLLSDVKVPQPGPQLSLLVQDACEPGPAADVLTVISWNLPQHLTALCIGPLAAPCPNDVLVTLATLTNLCSLQLQVRKA